MTLEPYIYTHALGMGPRRRSNILALMALAALASLPVASEPTRSDPDTGAATWETQAHGVTLSLTQLLPDQVRAFYVNRGFDLPDADIFARACVFMTVMRNDAAPGELSVFAWPIGRSNRLVRLGGCPLGRLAGAVAGARGERGGAGRLPLGAFPPEQIYAPGEWNQGMLATGLAPGSRFDLIARWTVAGQAYEGRLDDVRCSE